MTYTDADVERVAEAIFNETVDYPAWDDLPDTWDSSYGPGKDHYRSIARAALEAVERETLVHGDLLDRLTRVAEAGFHWWEAWADEGDYDGEYKHMDREQRIDHILCNDLLLALDALVPDYFDGLTGKPKYAVAAAKGDG